MGYAAFLKDDILEFKLDNEQRSDVFMNSLIVTLVQFFCVYLVWNYALTSTKFVMNPASSFQLIVARFLASMLMHLQVEKEAQLGLTLMKYSINHHENFTTPYPAFFLAFLHFLVNISVEVNVIIILTSIQDVLETLMKYVALAVASNIPRFYFGSLLSDNKMTRVN